MKPLAALLRAARRLPLECYTVDRPVDERGQYRLDLAPEFPLAVKRLGFSARQPRPRTWHTYLEIFVPISDACRVQMGGTVIALQRGDVLVMDHQRLHAVLDFPGNEAEAVVIRFLPEIVRSAGAAAAADQVLLLPFYCQRLERPHVVRAGDRGAAGVQLALAQAFESAAEVTSVYRQTGTRVHFLVALHHLARAFRAAEELADIFARQQAKHGRLREVFEFVDAHYAERVSLPMAAKIAELGRAQFHAVFKKAAGMTFLDYVNQVRLARAAQLLRETDRAVVEIAHAVGFADQSYFDRRFRRHFGRTPLQFRKGRLSL